MQYGRNLSAQALARAAYILAGATVFVLLARLLGPEQLGQYAWAIAALTLAVSLADLGTTPVAARDLVRTGDRRADWLANFLALRLLLGIVVGLGAAPLLLWGAPEALRWPLLLACPLLPLLAARFFDPVFQVAGRPWLSLGVTCVYVALAPLALVAVLLAEPAVPWVVMAHNLAGLGYGLAGLLLTLRLLRPRFAAIGRTGLAEVAAAAAPLALSALLMALATRADTLILAELGTIVMVGFYAAAYRFVDVGAAAIVTVLSPLLTVLAALRAHDRTAMLAGFRAMAQLLGTLAVLGGLLGMVLAETLLRILYGEAFAAAAPVLAVLGWKLAFAFVSLAHFALAMTLGPIRYVVPNSALALLIIVSVDLALVPGHGALGAAIGTMLGEVSQLAVNVWMLRRREPEALQPAWWGRLALATGPALGLALLPFGTGIAAALLQALVVAAALFGGLAVLRALPANPLPLLRVPAGGPIPPLGSQASGESARQINV